jgi:hypothetical protein
MTPFYFPGSIWCLFETQSNVTIWEQLHRRTHSLCRDALSLSYSPYSVSRYTKIRLYSSTPSSTENISIILDFKLSPCMLYVFFWVNPRLPNFICRRFGTLCFHGNSPASEFYMPTFRNSVFMVIPRRLNFICRRFGTHCSIFIGNEDGTVFRNVGI